MHRCKNHVGDSNDDVDGMGSGCDDVRALSRPGAGQCLSKGTRGSQGVGFSGSLISHNHPVVESMVCSGAWLDGIRQDLISCYYVQGLPWQH